MGARCCGKHAWSLQIWWGRTESVLLVALVLQSQMSVAFVCVLSSQLQSERTTCPPRRSGSQDDWVLEKAAHKLLSSSATHPVSTKCKGLKLQKSRFWHQHLFSVGSDLRGSSHNNNVIRGHHAWHRRRETFQCGLNGKFLEIDAKVPWSLQASLAVE